MANQELVPDAVWAQLRPSDARLTRLSYARLRLLGAAAVLIATLAALSAMSGLLMPQLNEHTSTGTAELGSRTITQSVDLSNDGWFTEHIDRIDAAGPGVRVAGQSQDLVIGPGKTTTLQVTIQILNCAAIQKDQPSPILVRLRRPWGHRTTTLMGNTSSGLTWTACHGAD